MNVRQKLFDHAPLGYLSLSRLPFRELFKRNPWGHFRFAIARLDSRLVRVSQAVMRGLLPTRD